MIFILLFLLVPILALMGVFAVALESVWAGVMFCLKYLLPGIVVALLIARKKDKAEIYGAKSYAKVALAGAVLNFLLLIICLQFPANPKFPVTEKVASVSVSRIRADGISNRDSTEVTELLDDLCTRLNSSEYSYTINEFIIRDEDTKEYIMEFTMKDGKKVTCLLWDNKAVAIDHGLFTTYYKLDDDDGRLPYQEAERIVFYKNELEREEKKKAAMEKLTPFVKELFDSIVYVDDESIEFVIPEKLPDTEYGICIEMKGTDAKYGERYTLQNYEVHKEEQDNNSWVPGGRYRIDIKGLRFRNFTISVTPEYTYDYTFNVKNLLPKEKRII
ncbi:MAG: hypothetical protein E7388_02240 [Ruminococcaceae bacterium]|nr:hypothetical protein [Oscillospiraceae bacterium]